MSTPEEAVAWVRDDPQGWAEAVREQVLTWLDRNGEVHPDLPPVRVLHSRAVVDDGRPVLHVVYRHPYWAFDLGLRRRLDDPAAGVFHYSTEGCTGQEVMASHIAKLEISDPDESEFTALVPDEAGVWWWGDAPLPGDESRRGPGPFPAQRPAPPPPPQFTPLTEAQQELLRAVEDLDEEKLRRCLDDVLDGALGAVLPGVRVSTIGEFHNVTTWENGWYASAPVPGTAPHVTVSLLVHLGIMPAEPRSPRPDGLGVTAWEERARPDGTVMTTGMLTLDHRVGDVDVRVTSPFASTTFSSGRAVEATVALSYDPPPHDVDLSVDCPVTPAALQAIVTAEDFRTRLHL